MNEVVLRCPNCGTTQEASGECEACHEAAVRYYCPNHTPGRWLDGSVCPACGATVDRGPAVRAAPPPREGATRPPAARSTTTRPAPPRARPADRRPVERIPVDRTPIDRTPARPAPPEPRSPRDVLRELREAALARRAARPEPPAASRRLPIAGCLMRLVIFVVLIIALLIGALWLFAGGAVHSWMVDVGQSSGAVGGVPAQTELGIAAYRRGDRAVAERELGEAARTYPRSALALLYLARIRDDAGDPERAAEYLREAAAREPDNPVVRRAVVEFEATHRSRAPSGVSR